ncbi:VOC family protein [Afipia sp. GAS231]|uniref:VOC family protein n=1 Tax=Afipia sp. GAS231 TaxID=1882747 RepID=UPI00087A385C|nr:VOC family protein [Afipia sp. GAS231]SDO55212.1 Catechol-2,3-dioxygenase [Afipia sp. GAS231]
MTLMGIDAVVFGVADMTEAKRFLDDWGVTQVSATADKLVYRTRDGAEVIVRPKEAADLPPAIEAGNTVREVVWGAADEQELEKTIARLKTVDNFRIGADGLSRVTDPNGMSLAFRVSKRTPMTVNPTQPNAPGSHQRVNTRSPIHSQARPINIGHVVLFAADFAAMRAFYTEKLGFVISDEYPNHGVFMRCQKIGDHHNTFVLNRPGKPGINHVAFTVTDIHEVIGGGIAMAKKGWKTEIGPGRHPISSAYFWYFENPLAAPLEYYADEDFCTEDWKPSTFERKPELFAEWAIVGGIDSITRRQAAGIDKSGRGHA